MNKTSTEVKRRYNAKTYKEWRAPIKFELFDKLEAARTELNMGRSEFLEYLLNKK